MQLIPIKEALEENAEFAANTLYQDILYMTISFYKKVGFTPPWIGYFAKHDNSIVGSGGFKGAPVNGTVEIAYGTSENYRQKGIGTQICRELVDIALKTNPMLRITARTLPENNFSTRILQKNGFEFIGTVNDPEDGDVWEWEFVKKK